MKLRIHVTVKRTTLMLHPYQQRKVQGNPFTSSKCEKNREMILHLLLWVLWFLAAETASASESNPSWPKEMWQCWHPLPLRHRRRHMFFKQMVQCNMRRGGFHEIPQTQVVFRCESCDWGRDNEHIIARTSFAYFLFTYFLVGLAMICSCLSRVCRH